MKLKKLKKLFAITMACTMMMSSMTVFAADGDEGDEGNDTVMTTPSETGDLTITSDVNYVDTTIYQVTLPTADGLSFALDPQGLSSLEDGAEYDADKSGLIVGKGSMIAKNESSVDIKVTGSFYIADSNTTNATTLLALADKAKIDNSKQQMCLTLQEKQSDGSTKDVIAITSNKADAKTEYSFTMGKAAYEFVKDEDDDSFAYKLKADADNMTKTELSLGGVVAKDFDWKEYTGDSKETLALHAVFKFEKAVAVPEMTKLANGNLVYDFPEDAAPTGALTVLTVNDIAKPGMVTNATVTYNATSRRLAIKAESVAKLDASGTIVATIGGTNYTLTYTR